jgi:LmbE family N-acetylglucosaminyl deacetylase
VHVDLGRLGVFMRSHPVVIVSPHPDDVAFSLGASLERRASRRQVHVVNLFSRQEYSVLAEDAASTARRLTAEEGRAAAHLRYDVSFADLPEAALRDRRHLRDILADLDAVAWTPLDHEMARVSERLVLDRLHCLQPSLLMAPLAAGHVDHFITAVAVILAWRVHRSAGGTMSLVFYEDLPYAAQERAVDDACARLRRLGLTLRPILLPAAGIEGKSEAIAWYTSQVRERLRKVIIDYACSFGPRPAERVWYVSADARVSELAPAWSAGPPGGLK